MITYFRNKWHTDRVGACLDLALLGLVIALLWLFAGLTIQLVFHRQSAINAPETTIYASARWNEYLGRDAIEADLTLNAQPTPYGSAVAYRLYVIDSGRETKSLLALPGDLIRVLFTNEDGGTVHELYFRDGELSRESPGGTVEREFVFTFTGAGSPVYGDRAPAQ